MPAYSFGPSAPGVPSGPGAIAINRPYIYAVSLVAAISGFLFGFDIAVINGALIFLREQFHLTEFQTEFAASALLIGCVAGASIAGFLSDRFGRRRILILSALLFALSSLGAALPRNLSEFTIARFLGGVAIGVASVLAPLYIAELAPPQIRGRLVSLNQMAIVTGILAAYSVNWGLASLGPSSWRWMFASAAGPSLAFFVALLFVPESPRWLAEQARSLEALAILARVGGRDHAARELRQIEEAIAQEAVSFAELFRPGLRRPLVIAVVLAVLQQITGINTVLFYGSIIFKEHAGTTSESAAIGANVIVGLVNFLATLVAIGVIDKLGRRPLLMISSAGMALAEIALGVAFLLKPPPGSVIVGTVLFCVACFAVGMGPGVWVLMSELFPTRIRGRAMSVATISLWVACVALTATFLSLVKAVTVSGAFWIYGAMCIATFVFVWRVAPETKGKTLEEIEGLWKR
ncbi:MAG TPA: sugar porter family MFS transporter [Bryobacteraceae bacterium]|nr:sugar porter family MFS transporter [Bryobacteraceae bacterium]